MTSPGLRSAPPKHGAESTESPLQEHWRTLYAGGYTLANLERNQLLGMSTRTLKEQLIPRLPVDLDRHYERNIPDSPELSLGPIAANSAALRACLAPSTRELARERTWEAAVGEPTFMNHSRRIYTDNAIAWDRERYEDLPLLWPLKLYAFEPFSWIVRGFGPGHEACGRLRAAFDPWIGDWLHNATIGDAHYLRGMWTPWAVSLRLQRWLRYLAWVEEGSSSQLRRSVRRGVFKHARFLASNVEWDVGGNHLIENGVALVMAGLAFEVPETDWTKQGISILETAGARQFLADGCHFERSSMYHVLTLTRYLTVVDLLRRNGRQVPDTISGTATAATDFLRHLEPPDGRLPLLNDAVQGESLPLAACMSYAEAVGVSRRPNEAITADRSIAPGGSGYGWLETTRGRMLIDGGPVAPAHLPGHAHSDTLGFLLWCGGEPVLTDTGTFGYVADERRQYARGVRGHNTVQVGELEPIVIAGKYLMGPRPTPCTRWVTDPVTMFEGRYRARPLDGPAYLHHRAIFAGPAWWVLVDTVDNHAGRPVTSRLHCHPAVSVDVGSDTGTLRRPADAPSTAVRVTAPDNAISIARGPYYPSFGRELERDVISIESSPPAGRRAQLILALTAPSIAPADIDFENANNTLTAVDIDGNRTELPSRELLPGSSV